MQPAVDRQPGHRREDREEVGTGKINLAWRVLATPQNDEQLEVLKKYTNRRKVLIDNLKKIDGVSVTEPMGAFYCIVKLPVKNAENFCQFLLEDFNDSNQTVMLAPAQGFYSTPGYGIDKVRFAFILKPSKLR